MITNGAWVAVNKKTGLGVREFFNPALKKKLNTEKYEAVDILPYLAGLNDHTDTREKKWN